MPSFPSGEHRVNCLNGKTFLEEVLGAGLAMAAGIFNTDEGLELVITSQPFDPFKRLLETRNSVIKGERTDPFTERTQCREGVGLFVRINPYKEGP